MSATFPDSHLAALDGFRVEIDPARERADIVLDRPPFNIVSMPQRDQLRLVFEALDEDTRIRIVVLRAAGEIFPTTAISRVSWGNPSTFRLPEHRRAGALRKARH